MVLNESLITQLAKRPEKQAFIKIIFGEYAMGKENQHEDSVGNTQIASRLRYE